MSQNLKYPACPASVQVGPTCQLLLIHKRHEEIGREKQEGPVELWRRHAKDREWMLVQPDFAPHCAGIILKMAVPIRVREHNIRCAVQAMLVRRVHEPAKIRLNTQHIKVIP